MQWARAANARREAKLKAFASAAGETHVEAEKVEVLDMEALQELARRTVDIEEVLCMSHLLVVS